jgi:hypothetical protein
MCGISLVYKDDYMKDAATVAATVVQRVIESIEVFCIRCNMGVRQISDIGVNVGVISV